MIVDNRKILISIVLLTFLLLPVVLYTEGPVRIILGFLFVLFFPGYTMVSALFPKQQVLSSLERLVLSFGASIAIVPLLGLLLNYTPWGIKVLPIFITVSIFIFLTSFIAWFRHNRLADDERLFISIKFNLSEWSGMNTFNKGLSIVIIIAIIIAIGALTFTIISPKESEPYTEFYLLGPNGKAENYPRQILFNEPADVIIVVVNREQQSSSYRIEVTIHDTLYDTIDTGTLSDGQKYEEKISMTPQETGENQRIEFRLYMNDSDTAYFEEPLYIYIDVITSAIINFV